MSLETMQIHLNSKFANSYNNNLTSDCNFFLPNIEIPLQHTFYISIVHAVIPYSFYSINKTNNKLCYNQYSNGVIYSSTILTITPGNYNAFQLRDYFTKNLSNITCSYDVISNKFSFVNSVYASFGFTKDSTCLDLIGFISGSDYITTNNILTCTVPINLSPNNCLCIQSNFITGNLNNTNQNDMNILVSIPITCPPYGLITYMNNSNHKTNLHSNTLNMINFKIVDQLGNTIDLNNQHFSITIQLDVVDFVN